MKTNFGTILRSSLALVLLTAGCASHKVLVVAHRDPRFSPSPTNVIAIAGHSRPGIEIRLLSQALTNELERQHFRITNSTNADYTLAYWIEDNWHVGNARLPESYGGFPTTDPFRGVQDFRTGGFHPQPVFDPYASQYRNPFPTTSPSPSRPLATQGIRLRLYPRGKLETAWEGFIDAGLKASPDKEPALIRALLAYFGRDFTGKIKLESANVNR